MSHKRIDAKFSLKFISSVIIENNNISNFVIIKNFIRWKKLSNFKVCFTEIRFCREPQKKYECMQCKDACCVSFFEKLHISNEEKELLEQIAEEKGVRIDIIKEKILKSEESIDNEFMYFLKIDPCPFYQDGCTIHENKPLMCKIYPIRNIKQISKKEYYFVIDHKCNWVKKNRALLEHPYRNLFKIFSNESEMYLKFYRDFLNRAI